MVVERLRVLKEDPMNFIGQDNPNDPRVQRRVFVDPDAIRSRDPNGRVGSSKKNSKRTARGKQKKK